jgi:hypothetical protein
MDRRDDGATRERNPALSGMAITIETALEFSGGFLEIAA